MVHWVPSVVHRVVGGTTAPRLADAEQTHCDKGSTTMTGTQYTDKTGETLTVGRDPQQEAFEVRTQADEVAGRTFFRTRGQERIFFHTEVSEEFGGRGIGTALVRGAVEATRAEGVQIVAVCPLVKGFLDKNGDEFAGAWRLPTPDDLSWLRQAED